MLETKWITFIIYTCITSLILTPICCRWLYMFHQKKDNIIVSKRTPTLTIIGCIFTILGMAIERPLYLSQNTYDANLESKIKTSIHSIPTTVIILYYAAIICFGFLQMSPTWIMLLRFWKIYFNVGWTESTLNAHWKIHI